MIGRVLIADGSDQRRCLSRVKVPDALPVCILTTNTLLLFGLQHMLIFDMLWQSSSTGAHIEWQSLGYLKNVSGYSEVSSHTAKYIFYIDII